MKILLNNITNPRNKWKHGVCRNWQNENHWRNEQRPIGERDENIGFPVSGLITGWRWFVSKYCQGTLPLPFDPLRLIFFITSWIVCLNKQHVSLHVSLAKQTLLSSTRIRFVSLSLSLSLFSRSVSRKNRNRVAFTISRVTLPSFINGLHMKRLKTVDLHFFTRFQRNANDYWWKTEYL